MDSRYRKKLEQLAFISSEKNALNTAVIITSEVNESSLRIFFKLKQFGNHLSLPLLQAPPSVKKYIYFFFFLTCQSFEMFPKSPKFI